MDERAGYLSRRAALTAAASFSLAAAVTACTPRPTSSSPTSPAGPATSSSSPRSAPTTLGPAAPTLAALSRQLSTALLAPHSAGFASVARLYNPRFDSASPPAAIARCRTAQDVASCVRFATESGSSLAMRAGGHSYGGRQATVLAADHPQLAAGILSLSYPLHPPRKPAELRTAHFPQLNTPVLFVHGSRDPFGSHQEMSSALALIPAQKMLLEIEAAGHELLGKKANDDLPSKIVQAFQEFFKKL